MFSDEELARYSRQILLPELDIEGQESLKSAHAVIVGLGGLGSPVAMYLAAAGVGELTLIDDDVVDLSNLQRQIIHTTETLAEPKVCSAQSQLAKLNPHCKVNAIQTRLTAENISQLCASVNVILDCSDNFGIRFLLNQFSVEQKIPLVSGAAVRFDGQVAVFDSRNVLSPCYRCLYEDTGEDDVRCVNNGVLAPVVGIVGTIQATETLKLLTGMGETLVGRLLLIDALAMRIRDIKLTKDPHCPVCRGSENTK